MRRALTAISILFLLAGGCGDDDGVATPDAGGGTDASAIDASAIDASAIDASAIDASAIDASAEVDASTEEDASTELDASTEEDASVGEDAGLEPDAGSDAGMPDAGSDAGVDRTPLLVQWCPISGSTPPGAYRGTLASSLNEVAGSCGGGSAPGRDAEVRIELPAGATLTASYRHAGDGILSLVDSCPALPSCLASGSPTSEGQTLTWTNTAAVSNPVYLILDSTALDGPQTFELDIAITGL